MEQKIYYRKVRDLGGIFGAAFGFAKQNFKSFYGSLLFLAGPFIVVGSAISAYMVGASMSFRNLMQGFGSFYGTLLVSYFFSMIFIFIGVAIYNVIINKNIIENEKLQAHEPLTIRHAISGFFNDFWRILGNMLLLGLVMVIAVIVLVLVFGGFFALMGAGDTPTGGGAIFMAVVMVILVFSFALILGPILSFIPIAAIFVCQRDRINVFAALRKVFYYIKGNFWITWVVSMVALLTYMLMGFIVQLPVMIITVFTTLSRAKTMAYGDVDQSTSLLLVIVTVISSLLSYAVLSIYYLMIVYQYTNLEEKKEGSSIIDKINQIQ